MTAQAAAPTLPRRLRHHYRYSFQDPRRERLFLSSIGFDVGAVSARVITHMIRHGIGPFHNITSKKGRHLHHLVFGIASLLGSGYGWLLVADAKPERQTWPRITAAVYGVGSALTLDEFALWLNLKDVYWTEQGKVSVEALMIFGGVLSIGVWGGPFLKAVAREIIPGVSAPPMLPLAAA